MAKTPRSDGSTDAAADPQLTGSVTPAPADAPAPAPEAAPAPVLTGLPAIAPLPEPSQEVLDAPPPEAPNANKSSGGESWDPVVHEDPPRENAKGGWARKRGGARKAGAQAAPAASAPRAVKPGAPTAPEALPQDVEKMVVQTGTLCAGLIFMGGEMIAGPCMKPDNTEKEMITTAFIDCCRAYGIIEIPPWLGLAAVLGMYSVKRWNHPDIIKIRERMQRGKNPKIDGK